MVSACNFQATLGLTFTIFLASLIDRYHFASEDEDWEADMIAPNKDEGLQEEAGGLGGGEEGSSIVDEKPAKLQRCLNRASTSNSSTQIQFFSLPLSIWLLTHSHNNGIPLLLVDRRHDDLQLRALQHQKQILKFLQSICQHQTVGKQVHLQDFNC